VLHLLDGVWEDLSEGVHSWGEGREGAYSRIWLGVSGVGWARVGDIVWPADEKTDEEGVRAAGVGSAGRARARAGRSSVDTMEILIFVWFELFKKSRKIVIVVPEVMYVAGGHELM